MAETTTKKEKIEEKESVKTTVKKNKTGYGYQYTDLAEIHKYLEDNNMSYYQYIETFGEKDYIMTVPIMNGKELAPRRGVEIVKAVLTGIKNPVQEYGSALTYSRRYSLLMAFGLATDDTDAQEFTTQIQTTNQKQTNATQKQIEILTKYYVGDNLTKLLNANNINNISEMPAKKASEIITELFKKGQK